MKLLRKSETNRRIAGVCGGLGEYLGIDPTALRLFFVFAAFVNLAAAALFYLGCWILMPPPVLQTDGGSILAFIGAVLVLAGAMELAKLYAPGALKGLWAVGLIGAGIALIYSGTKGRKGTPKKGDD